jgi:hypothetical protein
MFLKCWNIFIEKWNNYNNNMDKDMYH